MIALEIRRFYRSAKLLTISGVIVLGIGIGSSALTLSLLEAVSSLASPGMRHAGYATIAKATGDGGLIPVSWREFEKLQAVSGRMAIVAAYSRPIRTTTGSGERARPFKVVAVSSGFFPAFTEPLSAGRDFNAFEESTPTVHSVILSERSAISHFGSPINALGRNITIGEMPFKVLGVASPKFEGTFGDSAEAWVPAHNVVPLVMPVPGGDNSDLWKDLSTFYAVASSRSLSSKTLSTNLTQLLRANDINHLTLQASQGLTSDPQQDANSRKWLRLGALLSFVLTIVASLNYSLLLLSRAPRFIEEVRLKRALGARSGRLLSELIVGPGAMVFASLIVACAIWLGGLLVIAAMQSFYSDIVRASWQAGLLALAMQLPFACSLTFLISLLPALSLLRDPGVPRSGQSSTTSRRDGFLLQLPVIIQVAFCGCTWILAGMVVSASVAAMRAPLGYNPYNLKVISLGPKERFVAFTSDGMSSFPSYSGIRAVLDRVSAIPGVHSVTFASASPLEPGGYTVKLQRTDDASGISRSAYETTISPDYFKTLGTRIIRGRSVSWLGTLGSEEEIVLNESLARELWHNENPINRKVSIVYPEFAGRKSFILPAIIVGVTEDMRLSGPSKSPDPTFFSSITTPNSFAVTSSVIVDGSASLRTLQEVADAEVQTVIPELKVTDSSSVMDTLQISLRPEKERLYSALCGALIMGCLAYVGLFSALVYYVETRKRELAIRICLGASQWDIRKIVLRRAGWSAGTGILLSVLIWPLLAQLSTYDYLGSISWSTGRASLIAIMCVIVSLCVSLLPARSAASVSPARALKEQ